MARESVTKKTPFWKKSLDLGSDVAICTSIILLAPSIVPAVAACDCYDRYKTASRELYRATLWTRGAENLLDGVTRVIEGNPAALTAEEVGRLKSLLTAAQSAISRLQAFVEERAPGEDFTKVKRSKKLKMALRDEKILRKLLDEPHISIDSIREYLKAKQLM